MTISDNSQKIDFIHYLPNEIVYTIFSFLSFRERIHCLEISSTWRHYLLNWSLYWSNLDDPECDLGKDLLPYKQYIKNNSIQRVKLCELNVDQQRRALDFLVQLKSCSVKSIIFSYRYDMEESFHNLLNYSGHSITNIDITVQYSTNYSYEHLLIHCPSLESIKYQTQPKLQFRRDSRPSRELSLLQQQQGSTTTEDMLHHHRHHHHHQQQQQQQQQRLKLKSLYLKGITSIHQILNGDIKIPNIEYLTIHNPANNQITYIRQQGWPQLRYLHFNQVHFTPEGVNSLAAAIPNVPLLISLIFNGLCYFSVQTNELYSAIGNLEHLQELCIIDRQIDMRAYSANSPSQIYDKNLVTEEGYLSLLNGKCRRTLQKLKLSPITTLTNRMLAAIPDNHYHYNGELHQQRHQLTLLDLSQFYKQQREENNNNNNNDEEEEVKMITDEGLCSFASIMSCFKMDLVKLRLEKGFDLKTYKYMKRKMGPNCTIIGANNRDVERKWTMISDTGTWTIHSSIPGFQTRTLPSATDQVKHYAREKRKLKM